ncbi:protein WHAT'S THIS FACTOR 1 homolog [Selaginella moellendorffii]|nr:protein WHAT'S THIS FACTOR 1 homolog [Selaginella moellendorffii]|eukprot:XP_024537373.1 protein WHAT'S THIS FACTOR 1 homolog [Selaginella moellendorffii]
MSPLRVAAQRFLRTGSLMQTVEENAVEFLIPPTHRVKVLDQVALEDRRIEAVKQLVSLVAEQEAQVLMLKKRDTNRDTLLGVATKYPGVFQVHDEQDGLGKFISGTKYIDLTPEMDKLYRDELRVIKSRDELLSVNIVRKLLMMAVEQEISLTKISWLAADFGLPRDLDTGLVHRYPKFFNVRETNRGPVLKLASWDQDLTVTSREKTLLFSRAFPKTGFHLVERPRRRGSKTFQRLEFRSPYEPWQKPNVSKGSPVVEKRHIGVVHEVLSLLPRKRIALSKLTLLRAEMNLPKTFCSYLVRHPGIFYVSGAVEPPLVFLREAFFQNELKFKGPEDFIRDRYLILMQRQPVLDETS